MPQVKPIAALAPFALGAAMLCAAAAAQNVPWPRGEPPSSEQIAAKVHDAMELSDRERAEEFLEASEKGEDTEHITVQQEVVDQGRYSVERLFLFGDSTFEHEFRAENGYGDASHDTHSQRVHRGDYGGRDSFSCAGCHAVGGVNGAGAASANAFYFGDGVHISSAVVRNPPALLGLGYVQALAAEMTLDLQRAERDALAKARKTGAPVQAALASKGVPFGKLTARPDGSVDDSAIEGVDPDLVIKPFGWKGHTATLRRFAERAARLHFGVQAHTLALANRYDPEPARLGWSPNWWDPDGDGVSREMEEGTLTALAVYLALLEAPQIIPPAEPDLLLRWSRGSALFDRIGCSDCHRRELFLGSGAWVEKSDTTAAPGVRLDLYSDGIAVGEAPRAGTYGHIALFSDLKRHHMGDVLREAGDDPDGIGRDVFLTRPLWGAAASPPYLHDGRAADFTEAILQHGGEAETQRESFEALTEPERRDLVIFLSSLSREPRLRVER